jgi:hypothetical protein
MGGMARSMANQGAQCCCTTPEKLVQPVGVLAYLQGMLLQESLNSSVDQYELNVSFGHQRPYEHPRAATIQISAVSAGVPSMVTLVVEPDVHVPP